MRRLRVGPAALSLDGGELRAGPHVVTKDLALRVTTTVEPFDVQALDGMQVFRPVDATVQIEAKDFSPGLLALYLEGLTAMGTGRLALDVRVESGRLGDGSRAKLEMGNVRASMDGYVYEGAPRLEVSFDGARNDAAVPRLHAAVPGSVVVPVGAKGSARVDLTGLRADGTLSGNDVAEGISLENLDARLEEARIVDASAICSAILGHTPLSFVSPVLLGNGPLVASAAVDRRRTVTVALLRFARLGLGEVRGAARTSPGGWDGAMAGHLGLVPVGVRLKGGKATVALFVADAWLDAELAATGIHFQVPLVAP
jgi:hypothetical protein